MPSSLLVLFGAPAAGKNTVTDSLAGIEPRFELFRKLKVGGGRTSGYRVVRLQEVAALRSRGAILQESERYGNLYVVDRDGIRDVFDRGGVPVVHITDLPALRSLQGYGPAVLLRCSRRTAEARLQARDPGDVKARLEVWDSAMIDADEALRLGLFDAVIDTDVTKPAAAARQLATLVLR